MVQEVKFSAAALVLAQQRATRRDGAEEQASTPNEAMTNADRTHVAMQRARIYVAQSRGTQ